MAQKFLFGIPVFRVAGNSAKFISARECKEFTYNLPVEADQFNLGSDIIIKAQTPYEKSALEKIVGEKYKDPSTIIATRVLPAAMAPKCSKTAVRKLVKHCFNQWMNTYQHKSSAKENLKRLPFLNDGKAPDELLDDHEKCLEELFDGMNLFPTGEFAQRHYRSILKALGLRASNDVKSEEIENLAWKISDQQDFRKAACLADFVSKHTKKKFKEILSDIPWIPVKMQPSKIPHQYPKGLFWQGSFKQKKMENARNLVSDEYELICGSQSLVSPSRFKDLLPSPKPRLAECVHHIKEAIEAKAEMHGFFKILKDNLSLFGKQTLLDGLNNHDIKAWVQVEPETFVKPSRIFTECDRSTKLNPFIYPLPYSMPQEVKELVTAAGAQTQLTQESLAGCLQTMSEEFGTKPVVDHTNVACEMAKMIFDLRGEEDESKIKDDIVIHLLDCKNVLVPSTDLTFPRFGHAGPNESKLSRYGFY